MGLGLGLGRTSSGGDGARGSRQIGQLDSRRAHWKMQPPQKVCEHLVRAGVRLRVRVRVRVRVRLGLGLG